MSEVVTFFQGPEAASDKQFAKDESERLAKESLAQEAQQAQLAQADRAAFLRGRTSQHDRILSQFHPLSQIGVPAQSRASVLPKSVLALLQSRVPPVRSTIGG